MALIHMFNKKTGNAHCDKTRQQIRDDSNRGHGFYEDWTEYPKLATCDECLKQWSKTMDENFWIPEAMIRTGGGFVKALGHLFRKADLENQRRLREAFPEYWDDYREIALENWERWQAED